MIVWVIHCYYRLLSNLKKSKQNMEEFIENFNEFREFINAPITDYTFKTLIGEQGKQALDLVKKKFDELGLNDAF